MDTVGQPSRGLKKGDRVKLYFAASQGLWRRAIQAAIIEWRLNAHPDDFAILGVDEQGENELVFRVEIKASADKLLTEKKIANLILGYNPKGFALVFKNATVEFVQETLKPIAKDVAIGAGAIGLFVLLVLGLLVLKEYASD